MESWVCRSYKIVSRPRACARGDFDFLVPPGRLPAAGGTDYSLQREGKGKTHQGHICITSIPHCNRGVKGGGAPLCGRGKQNFEKLMRIRQTINMCKVCRVETIFSHTIYYQIFEQKNVRNGYMYPAHPAQAPRARVSRCVIRCFLPCTRYT